MLVSALFLITASMTNIVWMCTAIVWMCTAIEQLSLSEPVLGPAAEAKKSGVRVEEKEQEDEALTSSHAIN